MEKIRKSNHQQAQPQLAQQMLHLRHHQRLRHRRTPHRSHHKMEAHHLTPRHLTLRLIQYIHRYRCTHITITKQIRLCQSTFIMLIHQLADGMQRTITMICIGTVWNSKKHNSISLERLTVCQMCPNLMVFFCSHGMMHADPNLAMPHNDYERHHLLFGIFSLSLT